MTTYRFYWDDPRKMTSRELERDYWEHKAANARSPEELERIRRDYNMRPRIL
jgi:hypothetical protein